MLWDLTSDKVAFDVPSYGGQDPAYFESYNYYEPSGFTQFQTTGSYNPLVDLKNYADFSTTMTMNDFIGTVGFYDKSVIAKLIYELSKEGFIYYDKENRLITLKDKILNYGLAESGEMDYDNLRIQSNTNKINAELDLIGKGLTIFGVEEIMLSDSQNIVIRPTNHTLTLHENRNMNLSGEFVAGNTSFDGQEFVFNYDDFEMALSNVETFSTQRTE